MQEAYQFEHFRSKIFHYSWLVCGCLEDAEEVAQETLLKVFESFDPKRPVAFSSGCHAAVVAVDPETGHVEVLRYVIAHDTGRAINPVTLEGQLHGGFAHGHR